MSELNKKLFSMYDFQWNTESTFAGKCDIRTILPNFQALRSNYERVNFAYDILKEHGFLPDVIQEIKLDEEANERIQSGNFMFVSEEYHKAMQFYNEGIAYAKSQEILALAYEKRSAVFFEVKLYQECLQDIQYVLANNYPKSLEKGLNKRKQQAELMILKSKSRIMHDYFTEIPSLTKGNSNYFQCASNQVEIKYSKKFGHHLIAKKNIEPGDVLAIEKPYAQLLLHECRSTHCSHCLKLAYNLIPCLQCPSVMYCGQSCLQAAWDRYHQYECSISHTLLSMDASKVHLLALRVVLCARNEFPAVFNKQIRSTEELPVYKEESYEEIHNLVTNQEHRSEEDLFGRSLVAAILLRLLESTMFMDGDLDADDMKKCTADLLLHNLQTTTVNAHEITELRGELGSAHEEKKIGSELCAFTSLLNHSCYSNVTYDFYGTTVILRAMRSISRDQQLFISYGYQYAFHPRTVRQNLLKDRYNFTCTCHACINDWPSLSELSQPSFDIRHIFMNYDALANGNRQLARELIPKLLEQVKRFEHPVPANLHNMIDILEFLQQCFALLANKHTIFLKCKCS